MAAYLRIQDHSQWTGKTVSEGTHDGWILLTGTMLATIVLSKEYSRRLDSVAVTTITHLTYGL